MEPAAPARPLGGRAAPVQGDRDRPGADEGAHNRDLATALLAATPKQGWPAAPAGVLTRSHALGSLARETLGLSGEVADVITVLRWSIPPTAVTALADLRAQFGDVLADATLDWLAESTGVVSVPVRALLARGEVTDLVPVGLVLHVLTDEASSAPRSGTWRSSAWCAWSHCGAPPPRPTALATLGAAAAAVVAELADDERQAAHVNRVLNRAETLLEQTQTTQLAIHSDLLRRGFRDRFALLAEALRRGIRELTPDRSDAADASAAIESAWARARQHRLGQGRSAEVLAFQAAVRLWRWLQIPALPAAATVAERARHHLDHDGWADAAINDAATGVDDENLSAALRLVVEAALARRDTAERAFAAALAAATARDDGAADGELEDPVRHRSGYIERLLPRVVLPMARKAPVLLLVMDGMSAAAASEILDDATERLGWVEAALAGSTRRAAALSALPSLTEVSRASLLCGRLTRGQQDAEQAGYAELTAKSAKIKAKLFHKKGVDTTAPGALVADGVGAALDDTAGYPLVTVVLNTIDDALDRSDAAGTRLDRRRGQAPRAAAGPGRSAGRTVVVTADHGHVVERRTGTQRSYPGVTSGRSRSAVRSRRAGRGRGPRPAGPQRGRARRARRRRRPALRPAEGRLPRWRERGRGRRAGRGAGPRRGLQPARPGPAAAPAAALVVGRRRRGPPPAATPRERPGIPPRSATRRQSLPAAEPTLFDAPTLPAPAAAGVSLGQAVVGSEVFTDQRAVAARVVVSDEQVAALVDALAGAAAARLPMPAAAAVLGVSEVRVRGALAQVQQLLNVEGYAVLALDVDGQTVLLDVRLLREQFEVR